VLATQLRVRREAATRPRLTLSRPRRWPVVVCALAVGAAIWSATEGAARPGSPKDDLLANIFVLAMLVSLVTTPIVLAGAATGIGRLCGRIGRRTGWVGALVGGRWLAHRSVGLARVCAATVVGLGILMIVQVWVSQHSRAGEWSHVRNQVHEEIITIRTSAPDAASERFIAEAGPDRVLWVGENSDGRQLLVGACTAARSIGELPDCPTEATPRRARTAR
jgi:hypothetical protein